MRNCVFEKEVRDLCRNEVGHKSAGKFCQRFAARLGRRAAGPWVTGLPTSPGSQKCRPLGHKPRRMAPGLQRSI